MLLVVTNESLYSRYVVLYDINARTQLPSHASVLKFRNCNAPRELTKYRQLRDQVCRDTLYVRRNASHSKQREHTGFHFNQ